MTKPKDPNGSEDKSKEAASQHSPEDVARMLQAEMAKQPAAAAPPKPTTEEEIAQNWALNTSSVDFETPLLNCLSLLSSLYQTPVSKQALKSGLPNADINFTPEIAIRSAERAGFSSRIVNRKKVTDISTLVLPCILLLKNKNSCILLRFDKSKTNVEIMPAESDGSSIKMPVEKLQAEYLGYAIFAKPTIKLDKRTEQVAIHDRKNWFWGTLMRFWKIYGHVALASILVNCFALASPLFVMNVYDRVVPNNATDTLWVLAIGVSLMYLFDFILKTLRSYFVDTAGKNADVIIGSRLLEQVMGIKLDKMPPSIGSMSNSIKDFEGLRDFFSSSTVTILVDVPFLFLFLGVIFLISGSVAVIPLAAVPVVLLVSYLLQIPLSRVTEKSHKESSQKYALLFEALSGLETIKTNTAESKIQGMWERIVNVTAQSSSESKFLSNFASNFTAFIIQFNTVLIIIYGVYQIAEGNITMGALVATTMLAGRAMAPLGAISGLLAKYQQTKMGLHSLNELMKKPIERPFGKKFITLDRFEGGVEFKDVSFSYPEMQTKALDGVNIRIRPGEKVAILGRIGSGKSTLGRLLTGLYDPTEGSILLDGTEIGQLDPADVRQNVGYITQDNFLFYGTVRENIAFGKPHVNEQTIKHAAQIAGVTDFLRQTPQGMDLQVGERGMSLSGGQRQSIAIARALVFDPPILLMDEPTSNMDISSETRFIKRLEEYIRPKTIILITHRHSVLKLVDRLIIMDAGKIVADGPKDKIIEQLSKGEIKTTD